jgi:hypothetical protein
MGLHMMTLAVRLLLLGGFYLLAWFFFRLLARRRRQPSARQNRNEIRLSRAYRCFGFLGLVTLPFGLAGLLSEFGLMNFDEGSGGVGETLSRWAFLVGMLLGLPICAGMLYCTIYGIRQTVRFRHPALVALSAVSIVCGGGTMIYVTMSDVPGHPFLEYVCDIGGGTYIAANLLIPAWWFVIGRRNRSTAFAQE